jgi:hypothetical protein
MTWWSVPLRSCTTCLSGQEAAGQKRSERKSRSLKTAAGPRKRSGTSPRPVITDQDPFERGRVAVATLWIQGNGCYVMSKPRGDGAEYINDNRAYAPAWNRFNENGRSGSAEKRLHAEDGACLFFETSLLAEGKSLPNGADYFSAGVAGRRPFIAVYGKSTSAADADKMSPCKKSLISGMRY